MKQTSRAAGTGVSVVPASTFKAKALAVMRRVHDTGQGVTITSRGKPLVRIEPARQSTVRSGYGAMRGTVEVLVPEGDLIEADDPSAWRTIEEWNEASTR